MRTTVVIDDELLRQAKQEALDRGVTLSKVIEEALRDRFADRPSDHGDVRLPLITTRGSGLRDGVELADNAAVRDLMDGL